MTPDEKEDVLDRLKAGRTLEPLLRQRINQLVDELVNDDRISEHQFRLLLLLTRVPRLTDVFVMDDEQQKAVLVRSTKRKASLKDHKQALMDHVHGKHRVVSLVEEGGQKQRGGWNDLHKDEWYGCIDNNQQLRFLCPDETINKWWNNQTQPNKTVLQTNPFCYTVHNEESKNHYYFNPDKITRTEYRKAYTLLNDNIQQKASLDDIHKLLKTSDLICSPNDSRSPAIVDGNPTSMPTNNSTTPPDESIKEMAKNALRKVTKKGLNKFIENPTVPLMVVGAIFMFLFQNTFFWRPLGVKYFGKNAELHEELRRYYLERHTDALIRRGYTLEKLYDISDRRSKISRLMNKLHMKSSGRYGDERDRFIRMLNNEELEEYDDYDDEEDEESTAHTRKASNRDGHQSRKASRGMEFSLAEVFSEVATMTIRFTIPVMLAFYVATTVMAKDKLFPTAFTRMGNSEFSRLYSNPTHCKALTTRDVNLDSKPAPYKGQLETVDTQMHQLFTTHKNVDKLRYALLKLYQHRSNSSGRRVLPLHVLRTDGDVRTSAGEMARAVKHHWEKRNLVGVTRSRMHARVRSVKNRVMRRQRGGSHRTRKTVIH